MYFDETVLTTGLLLQNTSRLLLQNTSRLHFQWLKKDSLLTFLLEPNLKLDLLKKIPSNFHQISTIPLITQRSSNGFFICLMPHESFIPAYCVVLTEERLFFWRKISTWMEYKTHKKGIKIYIIQQAALCLSSLFVSTHNESLSNAASVV